MAEIADGVTEALLLGDHNWDPVLGKRSTIINDCIKFDLSFLSPKSHRLGMLIYAPTLTSSNMATEGNWLQLGSLDGAPFVPLNGTDPQLGKQLAVQVVTRNGVKYVEPFEGKKIFFSAEPADPNDLFLQNNELCLVEVPKHINCDSGDVLICIGDFCDWDPNLGIQSPVSGDSAMFDLSGIPDGEQRIGIIVEDPGISQSNVSDATWLDVASIGESNLSDTNGNDPNGFNVISVDNQGGNIVATGGDITYYSSTGSTPDPVVPPQNQVPGIVQGSSGPPASILSLFNQKVQQLGVSSQRGHTGVIEWRGSGGEGGYLQIFYRRAGDALPDSFALMKEDSQAEPIYLGGAIWTIYRDRHNNKWDANSFDSSDLGYPTLTEQVATSQSTGNNYVFARFEKSGKPSNIIHHTSQTFNGKRTFVVFGPIFEEWADLGYNQCPIGVPTSDIENIESPVPWPGHQHCQFELGRMTFVGSHNTQHIVTQGANRGVVAYRFVDPTKNWPPQYDYYSDRIALAALQYIGSPTLFLPEDQHLGFSGLDKNGLDCSGLLLASLRDGTGKRILLPSNNGWVLDLLHAIAYPHSLLQYDPNRDIPRTSANGLVENFFSRANNVANFEYTDATTAEDTGTLLFYKLSNDYPDAYTHSAILIMSPSGDRLILHSSGADYSQGMHITLYSEGYLAANRPVLLQYDVSRQWSQISYR